MQELDEEETHGIKLKEQLQNRSHQADGIQSGSGGINVTSDQWMSQDRSKLKNQYKLNEDTGLTPVNS